MSTEGLHFLSEARLAQARRFVEASTAALARLAITPHAARLDPALLRRFAETAVTARELRTRILTDLAPILEADGPAASLRNDPAAQRLVTATQQVADSLADMIARLEGLQEGSLAAGEIGA
ncbi:hypothetical protein [Dongia rigui]|uniref:Uncharacterized protein n=1 Tax=Dongia rigui TaxID=940149 RepID=A0ABU5DVZ3_9PROT|nr:hypothetical protein [Dongia rigui]MDY0871467.1 hypothetical protein [Dongia rigui]